MRSASTLALVALLLASAVAPSLLAGTAAASASSTPEMPPGFVAIPDQNIQQGTPASESFPYRAANMTDDDVLASAHASSTEFILTTPEDAEKTLGPNATVADGLGNLAIVIRDDSVHEGRRIAIRASEVRDALGYLPNRIAGVHEDGSRWSERVTTSSGYIVVEVPHFSDNVITFTGTVELSGNPATDGSSYNYDIYSTDSVSDFNISVTGRETATWANESAVGVATESVQVSFGGNLDLTGPSVNNKPTLELIGHKVAVGRTSHNDYTSVIDESWESEVGVVDGTIEKVNVGIYNVNENSAFDVRVVTGEGADGNYGEGTLVNSSYTIASGGTHTIHFNEPIEATEETVTVEFVAQGGVALYPWYSSESESMMTVGGSSYNRAGQVQVVGTPDSVSANADDGTSVSYGGFTDGETKTKEFPITKSASSVSLSADGGRFDWEIAAKENRQTDSPSVEVNGHWVNYTGLMNDGETASLPTNESWIQNGTNRVNVSLAGGNVNLSYSHTASDSQSVLYKSESWSERYNVTRTWGDAGENATLEIPFAGNVVQNRDLEVYLNGTQTAPTWSRFQNTTLEVGLGDLAPGTTARVVANGSKVRVRDGAVRVTNPTTEGNRLNTTFEVVSRGPEFRIDVSGTASSEWVHYVADPSYTNASASARIADGGASQYVRLPNAPEGGRATVRTLDLRANPQNDVLVSVADPNEPKFRIRPGEVAGDSVELAYHGRESGVAYDLVSESSDRVEEPGVTGSPVVFSLDSDASNLLRISVSDSGGTSSDGGGSDGGGGIPPLASTARSVADDPLANPLLVLGAGAAVILGVGVLARRRGVPMWASGGVLGLVFVVALESLAPGYLSGALARVVEELAAGLGGVSQFLWLAGGLVGLWALFRLVRKFTSPDRTILKLRGGK